MPTNGASFRFTRIAWIIPVIFGVGCGGSPESEADAVARLRELEALVIKDNNSGLVKSVNLSVIADKEKLPEALDAVLGLAAPKNLNVQNTPITDDDMKIVGKISSLVEVVANGTSISDAGISHLRGLDELNTLYLVETNVTDEALPVIAQFSNLKVLDLSRTKVSGDLAPLAQMKSLNWLLLADLTLPDEAFETLASAPGLSKVSLHGAQFSAEAVEKLRKAKPDLVLEGAGGQGPAPTQY